jgi:hypothetical protein
MKKVTIPQTIYYTARQARQYGLGFFPVNREGAVELELTEAATGESPSITVDGVPDEQKYGVACLVHSRLANRGMNVRVAFLPLDLPKSTSMYSDALDSAIQACRKHDRA